MTSHVVRLYALALALLVFFVAWAAIAARPWQVTAKAEDPRIAALAAREQGLRREAVRIRQVVNRRWAVYRAALRRRQGEIRQVKASAVAAAATPAVRVVTLPPLTITRTS